MKKIGFIGLGNMGEPMAANLVKAGFDVIGFDLIEEAKKKAERNGIHIAEDAVSASENVDALERARFFGSRLVPLLIMYLCCVKRNSMCVRAHNL